MNKRYDTIEQMEREAKACVARPYVQTTGTDITLFVGWNDETGDFCYDANGEYVDRVEAVRMLPETHWRHA